MKVALGGRARLCLGTAITALSFVNPANAQEDGTRVVVTPRVGLAVDDFGTFRQIDPPTPGSPFQNFITAGPELTEDAADFVLPMYGASLTVAPGQWSGTSLTATYMEGRDSSADSQGLISDFGSNVRVDNVVVPATLNGRYQTKGEYSRRELELSGQFALNDLTSLVVGLRIEQAEWKYLTCFQYFFTPTAQPDVPNYPSYTGPSVTRDEAAQICANQPVGTQPFGSPDLPALPGTPTVGSLLPGVAATRAGDPLNVIIQPRVPTTPAEYLLSTMRIGFTGIAPLTEDRAHSFFATGLLAMGYRSLSVSEAKFFKEGLVAGPDLTAGYRWQMAEDLALDVRYRVQAFWGVSGDASGDERPQITHGAILGISKTF